MKIVLQLEENSDNISYPCFSQKALFPDFTMVRAAWLETEIKKEKAGATKAMGKVDIFEAAKYIVALHYLSEKSYTCNRTKVEKLLAIADLISIKNGEGLFSPLPIFVNTCGLGYCVLSQDPMRFPMNNIIDGTEDSQKIDLSVNSIIREEKKKDIPQIYLAKNIDDKTEKLLTDVFCKFGAYSAKLIGSTMDDFKMQIASDTLHVATSKHYIDISKVNDFFSSDIRTRDMNPVVEYISNYKYEQ